MPNILISIFVETKDSLCIWINCDRRASETRVRMTVGSRDYIEKISICQMTNGGWWNTLPMTDWISSDPCGQLLLIASCDPYDDHIRQAMTLRLVCVDLLRFIYRFVYLFCSIRSAENEEDSSKHRAPHIISRKYMFTTFSHKILLYRHLCSCHLT